MPQMISIVSFFFFQIDGKIERQAYTMGSIVNFVAEAENAESAHSFINRQLSLFQKYDKLWSLYSEKSLLSKINKNSGRDTTQIDKSSYEVLQYAMEAFNNSKGIFNVAILPLLKWYGFYGHLKNDFANDSLAEVLKYIDFSQIYFDSTKIYLKEKMALSFDGLAVGFVLDKIRLNFEKQCKVRSLFVNHSGDLLYLNKDKKDSVKIYIRKGNRKLVPFYIKSGYSLASSGNYENFIIKAKKKIGHIINPISGIPQEGVSLSLVLGRNPIWVDIWSTIRMIDNLDTKLLYQLE